MKTILIDIDAGEVHCDGCQNLVVVSLYGSSCRAFNVNSHLTNMPRPAECLAAEKRAKEMK